MAKKKLTKKEKKLRKQLEVLKAQVDLGATIKTPIQNKKTNTQELDIARIKKDLKKTAIFAGISLIFIGLLHYLDVSFEEIKTALEFVKSKV